MLLDGRAIIKFCGNVAKTAPEIGVAVAKEAPWEKACIPYKHDSLFDFLGNGFREMSEFKRRLIATPMSFLSWQGNEVWLQAAVSQMNTPPPAIVRQVENTATTIFSGLPTKPVDKSSIFLT